MKIALVRGKFLTKYECQTFYPLIKKHQFIGFSSFYPYHEKFPFPVVKLPSPVDIPFGPIERLKMPILNRLFIDAHYLWGLEEKLKNFDIVHTADTFYHYTHQCIQAKKRGLIKKLVANSLENIPFNNETIWGRAKFKEEAIKGVDHFIAISEISKQCLIIEGCPEEKISIINQHIDITRFKPRVKLNTSNDITIIFVGRLEYYKGVYELLFAGKKLLSDKSLAKYNFCFSYIGNGAEKRRIIEISKKMNIYQKLEFKSENYDKIHEIYQKADIFVAPSRPTQTWQEQFNTSLIEAQASGLPIVTSTNGGIPENIGTAGLLIPPADYISLYKALKSLVVNPKMRQEYGSRARKQAENKYDYRKGAQKIEDIYQRVLSK